MMLLPLFGDAANYPFLVALAIVFILAAIEGVGMLIGAGIFGFLDGLLPDIDIDLDIDAPDMTTPSITGQVLTWLRLGELPVIFSLIVFLVSFGLIGLTVQGASQSLLGTSLPPIMSISLAFLASMPVLSFGNRTLAAVMPRDETSAISRDKLIGKIAEITLGEAHADFPAQAKVKDRFGQIHYVMLVPDNVNESFSQGDRLLLVRREGAVYYGIQPHSKAFQ